VSECRDGSVRTFYIHPADYGLAKAPAAALKGGDAATNAAIVRAVLDGADGAPREVILLNAGAALFVAGDADSIPAGIASAAAAIDSGAAARTLSRLIEASR
jgi:anthranilate phosphoribosyltransferase